MGSDGEYNVEIHDVITGIYQTFALNVPSGKVCIGAGEDTSGGDLEPNGSDYMSGFF
ncbi:DUF6386 family protein [Pantoea stewartii]|uniref:DUF6386 family protein n=1 Tax=Pantoea stewartii TaxID=66269 RepID=UPI002FCA59E9